jgi:hypothetical protein
MVTNITGPGAFGITIGDPVFVTFVTDQLGRVLPQFQRMI